MSARPRTANSYPSNHSPPFESDVMTREPAEPAPSLEEMDCHEPAQDAGASSERHIELPSFDQMYALYFGFMWRVLSHWVCRGPPWMTRFRTSVIVHKRLSTFDGSSENARHLAACNRCQCGEEPRGGEARRAKAPPPFSRMPLGTMMRAERKGLARPVLQKRPGVRVTKGCSSSGRRRDLAGPSERASAPAARLAHGTPSFARCLSSWHCRTGSEVVERPAAARVARPLTLHMVIVGSYVVGVLVGAANCRAMWAVLSTRSYSQPARSFDRLRWWKIRAVSRSRYDSCKPLTRCNWRARAHSLS